MFGDHLVLCPVYLNFEAMYTVWISNEIFKWKQLGVRTFSWRTGLLFPKKEGTIFADHSCRSFPLTLICILCIVFRTSMKCLVYSPPAHQPSDFSSNPHWWVQWSSGWSYLRGKLKRPSKASVASDSQKMGASRALRDNENGGTEATITSFMARTNNNGDDFIFSTPV